MKMKELFALETLNRIEVKWIKSSRLWMPRGLEIECRALSGLTDEP